MIVKEAQKEDSTLKSISVACEKKDFETPIIPVDGDSAFDNKLDVIFKLMTTVSNIGCKLNFKEANMLYDDMYETFGGTTFESASFYMDYLILTGQWDSR